MISLINFGMGNIYSVANAFQYWKQDVRIITTVQEIEQAEKLVLPGVGSFREAMNSLEKRDFINALHDAVLVKKVPLLGICLGMQIMAQIGYEDGISQGLGWLEGEVVPLLEEKNAGVTLPHIGFNEVINTGLKKGTLLGDIAVNDYYFCHGYKLVSTCQKTQFGFAHYGEKFIACLQKDNIWGTQFHPEKSQANGLALIKRFIDFRGHSE